MTDKFGAKPWSAVGGALENLADNALTDIQNIFSVTPHGKYVSGARTTIRINGRLAAFAFAVSWKIDLAQDEVWTVDDWTPYEYAPKRITVEGTIGGFHIPGKGPITSDNAMGKPGNNMVANLLDFMFHKYITIEVRDRSTDNVLFKTNKAVITSYGESIQAERLGQVTLNFKAIGWVDGRSAQYPDGIEPASG